MAEKTLRDQFTPEQKAKQDAATAIQATRGTGIKK